MVIDEKPTLYLETSVVSYHVAKPARDVIVLAHQEITRQWWDRKLGDYQVFVSDVVFQEAERVNREAADRRVQAIRSFQVLALTPEASELAEAYMRDLPLPPKAARDALHLSIASLSGIEYLVTWNFQHLANARVRRRVATINSSRGVPIPTICTPEELLGEFQDLD